jgi:hypothetical protein
LFKRRKCQNPHYWMLAYPRKSSGSFQRHMRHISFTWLLRELLGAPGRRLRLRPRFHKVPGVLLSFTSVRYVGRRDPEIRPTLRPGTWPTHSYRGASPLHRMEDLYATDDTVNNQLSSFTNGDDVSSQQSPTRPNPPILQDSGSLTDLFGGGGLWPLQTIVGACWWWGWRSHRPGAPQGFGSSYHQAHPHPLHWPPCLYGNKSSCQGVCTKTTVPISV